MKRNIISGNYHIVSGKDAPQTVRIAAQELQKYLYEATDTCVPVFSDHYRCPKRGPEIIVGTGCRDIDGRLDVSGMNPEGFRIKTDGEDILIAGCSPRGTLYGVYTFLEIFAGFRRFSSEVYKVEKKSSIIVDDIDFYDEPAFEYRESYWRDSFDGYYAAANKLNSNLALLPDFLGGKTKWHYFHHSFYEILPPAEYFGEHPEYYSLIDGKRQWENGQLCLSNPDVLALSIKQVRKWIVENLDCKVFSVAQVDGHNYCKCENCRVVDEYECSPSGSVIKYVNAIADDIKADYPDILIHTFAYVYSRKAPKHVRPADNVIVRLCDIECSFAQSLEAHAAQEPDGVEAKFLNDLSDWSKICNHLYIWDYVTNFAHYLMPFPNLESLAANMKLFKRMNVKGMLVEGNFSYGGKGSMAELQAYLQAKLMWNPDIDFKATLDEFLNGYFEEAAPYIKKYLDLMQQAVRDKRMGIYVGVTTDLFSDELLNVANQIFTEAENVVSGAVKDRVKKEHLAIQYLILARLPIETSNRNELIDEFYAELRRFRITEIHERCDLAWSINAMKTNDLSGRYSLYYIMR